MKLIDTILYIETSDLTKHGVDENTIHTGTSRKSAGWKDFIKDPDNNKFNLYQYEKLGATYKKLILEKYGDPYKYVARIPILNMVEWDNAAELYYTDYRYNLTESFSPEKVKKYTKAASWLNMLKKVNDDKSLVKKNLNISLDVFYNHVLELFEIEKVDLPRSFRRLYDCQKRYAEKGYESLIPTHKFGNKGAAKVKGVAEDVLDEMLDNPKQYDDVFICRHYNKWAVQNGFKEITPAAVGVHRKKKEYKFISQREGKAAYNRKYAMVVKGSRPSFPLSLVESDDNYIDLQYIDVETDNKFVRYICILVVDSFNDYVLGYAYSTKLSNQLIQAAYINAMYNIKRLTGGWYLPHEIKTDNWSIGSLQDYYKGIAYFEKSATGSKNRGYIEQFFGTDFFKNCMKIGANNYTGNNMTAKTRGVNLDVVNKNIPFRPKLGKESENQMDQFIFRLRNMPDSNNIVKETQWLQAWEKLPEERKRKITDEQFLIKFGINHHYNRKPARITNRGVEVQINNVEYSFDLAQYNQELIGKEVQVLYDPFDMSRVLVTDMEKIRIIGVEARLPSRAHAELDADGRIYLNAVLQQKKKDVVKIGKESDERKKRLKVINIDNAEAMIQSGVMIKEIKMEAEQKMLDAPSDKPEPKKKSVYNKY